MDRREAVLLLSRGVMLLCSLCVLVRCLRSMLRERYDPETWAYLRRGKETFPLTHWEILLGRSRRADVSLDVPKLRRFAAVLRRDDKGSWRAYDIFARGGVWVNGQAVSREGLPLKSGDILRLEGVSLRFLVPDALRQEKLDAVRETVGRRIGPALTLLELTVFQLFLLLQHSLSARETDLPAITMAFALLIILQWSAS